MEIQEKRGKNLKKISASHKDFKERLWKKFSISQLKDVTRDPKDYIADLELLMGDLWKLNANIDDIDMMAHIQENLLEAYKNITENLQDALNDKDDPLTIKKINDKLAAKYDCLNVRTKTKSSNG